MVRYAMHGLLVWMMRLENIRWAHALQEPFEKVGNIRFLRGLVRELPFVTYWKEQFKTRVSDAYGYSKLTNIVFL